MKVIKILLLFTKSNELPIGENKEQVHAGKETDTNLKSR